MIIIGHDLIPSQNLYKVTNVEQIKKTPPNSTILFDFNNKEVLEYIKKVQIPFAVFIESATQACLANALGATYIITDKELLEKIQKIANEYLFDTKVLYLIKDEKDMEYGIENFVDGVLFGSAIK